MSAKPAPVVLGEAAVDAVEACSGYLERRFGLLADMGERSRLQRRIANAVAAELAERVAAEMSRRTEEQMWRPPVERGDE